MSRGVEQWSGVEERRERGEERRERFFLRWIVVIP